MIINFSSNNLDLKNLILSGTNKLTDWKTLWHLYFEFRGMKRHQSIANNTGVIIKVINKRQESGEKTLLFTAELEAISNINQKIIFDTKTNVSPSTTFELLVWP